MLAGLLALCSAISFTACAGNNTPSSGNDTTPQVTDTQSADTTPEEPVTTRLEPNLPTDITFEGEDFNYMHWVVTHWGKNNSRDLVSEAENGETINDAVFRRNSLISERYGVKFSVVYEEYGNIGTVYSKLIRSDDHTYDVIFPRTVDSGSLVTEGLYYDLTQIPHLDFSQPWWDQSSVKDLSINNRLYMVASDLTIIDKDATAAFIFNKKMAEDYNLPDIYQVVSDGNWTLDTLVEYSKGVSGDINGDSVIDENDRYGIIGQLDFSTAAFNGSGARFAQKDSDDLPYDSFYTERNVAVCQKILEIMYNEELFFNCHLEPDVGPNEMFANNQGLFKWIRLEDVTYLREFDTDFGIIPTPKYNAEQENYYSTVSVHNSGLITVPSNHNNLDKVGIVLEALSAESKYILQPAYYDVSLKTKAARDEESSAMLDLIIGNRVFDVGDMYCFANFATSWLYLAQKGESDVEIIFLDQEI